ncbi:MAG: HAD family phosphatase [Desulfofustis sp.]|nr:HAD family phosphatase [Desulfofustis sp.]
MIRALLFDFGRVISAPKSSHLFTAYERDLGLRPGSINRIMFDSPLWERALVGDLQMEGYWQAIGPELNLNSKDRVEAFRQRYYSDEKINQEVVDLIKTLVGNCRLGIVSNHPPGLEEWLADWQILELFDTVVSSAEVGVAKPDEKIFQIALERLGIEAAEALFIDDTEEHVLAARSLGMAGHHFSSAGALVDHLSELGIGIVKD